MALPMFSELGGSRDPLSITYVTVVLSAGGEVVFTDPKVFGAPANLVAITSLEDGTRISINQGPDIELSIGEQVIMVNVVRVNRVRCSSGRVKIFATIVPKNVPSMFMVRGTTSTDVFESVLDALQSYGAARDETVSRIVNALASVATDSMLVTIRGDQVGLAKDSTLQVTNDKLTDIQNKLAQPNNLFSAAVTIDNSAGSTDKVQPLFSESTPSRKATIKRDPNDTGTIYIGGSSGQSYPLNPGDEMDTYVSDLSAIYVRVPPGVIANLYVEWEK